jgi:hypothetical protein
VFQRREPLDSRTRENDEEIGEKRKKGGRRKEGGGKVRRDGRRVQIPRSREGRLEVKKW